MKRVGEVETALRRDVEGFRSSKMTSLDEDNVPVPNGTVWALKKY